MITTFSYTKRRYLARYPSTYIYADTIQDKHIRYRAKVIRHFFNDLKNFLESNKDFFRQFGSLMKHKLKTVNPENNAIIDKSGYEYITDTINVFTDKGVFQIRFDVDEKIK